GMTLTERHDPGEWVSYPDGSHRRQLEGGAAFLRCGEQHHEVAVFWGPKVADSDGDTGRRPAAGPHHFSFVVDGRAAFEEMLAKVRGAGVEIVHGPVKHSPTHPDGDGSWGENRSFYFCDPDGNRIEITCEMARFPA